MWGVAGSVKKKEGRPGTGSGLLLVSPVRGEGDVFGSPRRLIPSTPTACLSCPLGQSAHSVTVFFFQAEDGLRYATVTGVQTCALPILRQRLDQHAAPVDKDVLAGLLLELA